MSKIFPFRASKHVFKTHDEHFKRKVWKKNQAFFVVILQITPCQDVVPRKKARWDAIVKFSSGS